MDEDTFAESLVQGLGKMRQLMGAKYALWATLQLMAEIFCQAFCGCLLFAFGDMFPTRTLKKMLSMLSSPNIAFFR